MTCQRDALIAQLGLARELDLPVIVHNRESHEDMITLLRAHGTGVRGVFHCFIGDRAMANDAPEPGILSVVRWPADVSTQRGVARCRGMGAS